MRALGYVIVATALVVQASADPADAYDVAPGCTTEQFVELFEAGHSPEEIIDKCKKLGGDCSGLDCYEETKGKFINGKTVPQQPAEPDHTAESCAERCNEDKRCLSFEMYDDTCSLNSINTKKHPDALWDSEHYVYYEHISRVNKDD